MVTATAAEMEPGSPSEPTLGRLTVAIAGLDRDPDGAPRVTRVLESVRGVVRVYVNRDTEMAYVEYRQAEVTPEQLVAAIDEAGLAAGEVAVRPTVPSEAFPGEGAPPEDDLVMGDHSCCGPSVSEESPATGASEASPGVPAGQRSRSGAAPAGRGWPFRARLGLFLAAFALVLGPALWLVRPMSTMAGDVDYSVNMSMTGFTPPSFSIPAGKAVSLQLNNVDSPFHGVTNGALHQFAIDRLGIDVRLDGKESTRITLPPLEAGRYEFYCNVCCGGKVNPSMLGTITVGDVEGAAQR